MRRIVTAGLLVYALTACGTVAADQEQPLDTPTSVELPTEEEQPDQSEAGMSHRHQPDGRRGDMTVPGRDTADNSYSSIVKEGTEDSDNPGFVVGEEFVDSAGTPRYRLRLADNNPVLLLDDNVIDHGVHERYSDAELSRALSMSARFVSEELATSVIAFDFSPGRAQQWWAQNAGMFAQGADENIYPELRSTDDPNNSRGLLYTNNGWQRGTPLSAARVKNLTVRNTKMTTTDSGLLMRFAVRFDAEVHSPGDTLDVFTESTFIAVDYSLVLDDGEWKIGSYTTEWITTYNK